MPNLCIEFVWEIFLITFTRNYVQNYSLVSKLKKVMSKSFTFRESCAKNLLGYKNLIGKVMDKSYAYYKRGRSPFYPLNFSRSLKNTPELKNRVNYPPQLFKTGQITPLAGFGGGFGGGPHISACGPYMSVSSLSFSLHLSAGRRPQLPSPVAAHASLHQ